MTPDDQGVGAVEGRDRTENWLERPGLFLVVLEFDIKV